MTESQANLTVRIKLAPAGAELPVPAPEGNYRWDRIIAVAVLLLLVAAGTIWLLRTPDPLPPAELESLPGAISDSAAGKPEESAVVEQAYRESDAAAGTFPEVAGGPGQTANQLARPDVSSPAADTQGARHTGSGALAAEGEETSADPSANIPAEYSASSAGVASSERGPTERGPTERGPTERGPTEHAATAKENPGYSGVMRDPPLAAIETRINAKQVRRFVITNAVKGREPVGDISDIRPDREVTDLVKVIAFSEVSGFGGKTLRYRWIRGDKVSATVPVQVGSDSWRSYTSKYLNGDMRGRWRVELLSDTGEALASSVFEY